MRFLGRALLLFTAFVVPVGIYNSTAGERRDQAIRSEEDQIRDLDRRVEQARAADRKLPQFREEWHRLEFELDTLRVPLPVNPDGDRFAVEASSLFVKPPRKLAVGLRDNIEGAAERSHVILTHCAPHRVVTRDDGLRQLSADVSVSGNLRDIDNFLGALEAKSLIIYVPSVALQKKADGTWQADLVASSFSAD